MNVDAAHRAVLHGPAGGDARDLRSRHLSIARRLAALLITATLAGLGACGPLPRPFKPESKGGNELLLLPDRHGIAVGEPTGDVPDDRMALAEAMAEALRKQNVTASVASGNLRARWLLANVDARPLSDTISTLHLTWELYDSDGGLRGRHEQVSRVPRAPWRAGEPEVLARVAREAAPEIAAMIQAPEREQRPIPGYPARTRVVVAPVVGQPGQAARALRQAMARRLRERGLPVADHRQPGDIVIEGRLDLGPVNGVARPIEIVWLVRRAGADDKMGDLRQANRVPQARIEAGWTPLADTIARAAMPGVLEIVAANARNR